MSTYTSEPGTKIAGRYRLMEQTSSGGGWTMWKAQDETLARPVSVLTFASGFPRIPEVVTAARAASRLTDPRLAQVFDVEDGDGDDQAYVVMEWVSGETLAELVAAEPMEPGRGCALMAEAARALAGAHAAGQAHLLLTPESLRWTRSSGVKIIGIGIDAALAGAGLADASDPALTDTADLAGLAYAALTGYWPRERETALPPAPTADGEVCTPRQVSADIPADIDAVVTRALFQRPVRHAPPILTPDAFAVALAEVAPPIPLPLPLPISQPGSPASGSYGGFRPSGSFRPANGFGADPDDPETWSTRGNGSGTASYRAYPAQRGTASRAMVSVVVVLVLAAVAAGTWMISNLLQHPSGPQTSPRSPSSPHASAAAAVLQPVSGQSFNILGDGDEDPQDAQHPISGTAPAWQTEQYTSANFGGLKSGTGYLVDMGKPVKLGQVTVQFGSQCCSTAAVYLGNSAAKTRTAMSHYTLVAPAASVSGQHIYTISSNATGRYILIWFTSLPSAGGQFQGQISQVTVRGSSAGGN